LVAKGQIAEFAAEAFKDHEVTRRWSVNGDASYRCGKPGTSIYAFNVVTLPGAVVFYGDLGEAILRPSDRDVLPWLRGAVNSADYLISKVKPAPEQTFYVRDAIAWIEDQAEELVTSTRMRLLEAVGDGDRESFARELSEVGLLDHRVPGDGHSADMLWLVEALRWFVAHQSMAKTMPVAVTA
jgi:hypothetical protein